LLTEGTMTATAYTSKKLTVTISGTEATSTEVYCGNRGEPLAIYITRGNISWSYNPSTTSLSLNVFHECSTRILIYWKHPADVNNNGVVDARDLTKIGKAYGATPSSLNWNEACDINGDEIIDEVDLTILEENYGEHI
ncbi:MAG: hypothetical protein JSW53_03655, partial [Candidatus Bathyarchaeota archaeon]